MVTRLRSQMTSVISADQSSIEIQRTTIVEDYGRLKSETTETLDAQTMRLSLKKPLKAVQADGSVITVQQWSLLAEYDADIQRGDVFEHDGKTFHVIDTDDLTFDGGVYGKQATVEEVSSNARSRPRY